MPDVLTREQMNVGYQIADEVWSKAISFSVDFLGTLVREIESGGLPPMCGVCALNFAIDTLQKIHDKQRALGMEGAMHVMEPKGNA